jgi:putative transposase
VIRQVKERGYPVSEAARRLGVSTNSLYKWLNGVSKTPRLVAQEDLCAENARLKSELKRVEEGRDIQKKGHRVLCQGIRARYAFVAAHRRGFRLTTMCRVLRMHRSGYYAWLISPRSRRATEEERIMMKVRVSYPVSNGVYGSPRVHRDLREDGERCGGASCEGLNPSPPMDMDALAFTGV